MTMKLCKRLIAVLLALSLIFVLAACGGDDKGGKDKDKDKDKEGVYTIGDFTIEVKSAAICPDEDGFESVIVTMEFTNNSDADASYGFTFYDKASQADEFMYVAALTELQDGHNNENIAPGESIEVYVGWLLNAVDYQGNLNYDDEITVTIDDFDGGVAEFTLDPKELDSFASISQLLSGEAGGETGGEVSDDWISWWEGDWFGWWGISEADGYYADFEGYTWDACARISAKSDLTGSIEIWDEANDNVCLADVSFTQQGGTVHGSMVFESGEFMDLVITGGDIVCDPADMAVEDLICIEGTYTDSDGSYTFAAYLRPWGTDWSDLSEGAYPDLYYDWYLPLIEANAEMPDYFD